MGKKSAVKKPFVCNVASCRKRYTLACSLFYHQRNVHGFVETPTVAAAETPGMGVGAADASVAEAVTALGRLADATVAEEKPRPYVCMFQGCDKSYTRLSSLCNHAKAKHHAPALAGTNTGPQYACPSQGCTKVYSLASTLFNHMKKKHPDEPVTTKNLSKTTVPLITRHSQATALVQDPDAPLTVSTSEVSTAAASSTGSSIGTPPMSTMQFPSLPSVSMAGMKRKFTDSLLPRRRPESISLHELASLPIEHEGPGAASHPAEDATAPSPSFSSVLFSGLASPSSATTSPTASSPMDLQAQIAKRFKMFSPNDSFMRLSQGASKINLL